MFDPTITAAIIGALATIAAVLIPFIMKKREARAIADSQSPDSETAAAGADLRISQLDGYRLQPLDGHPLIEQADRKIHCGGCKIEFELSHNGRAQEPITLLGLVPLVADFDGAVHEDLAYQLDGDRLHAAGTARVHEFRVTIVDGVVQPAKWILDPKAGAFELSSTPQNMLSAKAFDVHGSNQFKFLHDETDSNTLRGFVLAIGTGLFSLSFRFVYSVAGKEREHVSERVWIYSGR